MAEKSPNPPQGSREKSVENELDELNMELMRKRNRPNFRKAMEATIESDSRQRRKNEAPASKARS